MTILNEDEHNLICFEVVWQILLEHLKTDFAQKHMQILCFVLSDILHLEDINISANTAVHLHVIFLTTTYL